ncbi:hypothetical protein D1841_03945 [Neglecta sp. X4]|nr:hypothetical protein [Neglectibacter sp. X4]NCE80265.1 hypothetical protein [Neglectibacter sp. X58]
MHQSALFTKKSFLHVKKMNFGMWKKLFYEIRTKMLKILQVYAIMCSMKQGIYSPQNSKNQKSAPKKQEAQR